MFIRISYLLLIQLFLLLHYAFAAGITIAVAPESKVDGPFITLGKIAEISGSDMETVNHFRQLKLGTAPSLGSNLVLTKEFMQMRLAATGADFSDVNLGIPEKVTVSTNSQYITGAELLAKAVVLIEKQTGLSVSSGNLTITPIGSMQDVITPVGASDITMTLPYGIRYNTPTNITATIRMNGQLFTRLVLKLDVKLYKQVVVVTGPLSFGEILTTEKVGYERKDIGHLSAGYFTDINKVLGFVARRTLAPGMVMTESMLNKPLLIKRGSNVNIVARNGGMEITAPGIAMQDGSLGQIIKVQNISSTRVVTAKVLDETTVQVLTYKSNL